MSSNFIQCKAITKKGTRCTRKATVGNYCTQHYDIYIEEKEKNINIEIPEDIVEHIISDYLEYEDIKELQTKFNNFKISKNRIEKKEILKNNGGIKEIHTYVDGVLVQKEIFSDYGEREILNFKNGLKEGKQYRYYRTGVLYYEENYKNGFRDGEQYVYHGNGKLYQKQNFTNGKSGELFTFDTKGKEIHGNFSHFY